MSGIYALCDELFGKFNQQINRDQVTKVKNSAKQYKNGFDGWIALWDKQQVAEEKMVAKRAPFQKKISTAALTASFPPIRSKWLFFSPFRAKTT